MPLSHTSHKCHLQICDNNITSFGLPRWSLDLNLRLNRDLNNEVNDLHLEKKRPEISEIRITIFFTAFVKMCLYVLLCGHHFVTEGYTDVTA